MISNPPIQMNIMFLLDINDCKPNPCEHGSCNDEVNGYNCDCEVGWEGKDCDEGKIQQYVNIISDLRCHNVLFALKSIKLLSYIQFLVSIDIDECNVSNPCENGKCTNEPPGDYTCTCDPGWHGRNCSDGKA